MLALHEFGVGKFAALLEGLGNCMLPDNVASSFNIAYTVYSYLPGWKSIESTKSVY